MLEAPRPRRGRAVSALAAAAMVLSLLALSPTSARAHDSCAVEQPTATGLVASALAYANVFSSFLQTEHVECTDKYAEVATQMDRDWVSAAGAVDPFERTEPQGRSNRAPRTFSPCVRGMAADMFACDGIDMMSHVSMNELGLGQGAVEAFVNDMWGWTDTSTRKDYALLGSSEGTVFVDISDAKRPEVLGILPTASTLGGSSWRDIKVFDDHAFVVSEHTNHGVQVFDLTRLRDWDGTYTTYDADARYTGHGSAHNINVNTDTGFAYSVGAGTFAPAPFAVTVGGSTYDAGGAGFGLPADQTGFESDLADVGGPACDVVDQDLTGTIAIVDRGACAFTVKALNVQAAGAIGVVVVNNQPGAGANFLGGSSAEVLIPAVSLSFEDGAALRASLPSAGRLFANAPAPDPLCGDGLHMIDVNDPKNPTFAGCERETGYVHDTQCVVYDGPDADFRGREICFNSNGLEYRVDGQNYLSIVDVTDKSSPEVLSRLEYDGSGYSHQGWLTEDRQYFLHGDEGDEILTAVNTTTRVWDVSDLREPEVVDVFVNDTASIDHNIYTQGDLAYASNYTSGLRVYDVGDVARRGPVEVAYFDIYPQNDAASFEGGAWSSYPYFRQKGIVAVSSIDRGLFVLRPRGAGNGG